MFQNLFRGAMSEEPPGKLNVHSVDRISKAIAQSIQFDDWNISVNSIRPTSFYGSECGFIVKKIPTTIILSHSTEFHKQNSDRFSSTSTAKRRFRNSSHCSSLAANRGIPSKSRSPSNDNRPIFTNKSLIDSSRRALRCQ